MPPNNSMEGSPVRRSRRDILPNPPRFQFTEDPSTIVIPELDTSAPPAEQLEQLNHLITQRLQNIDANMAKINEMLAARLLPAIKKFAIATEPVRQASDLWVGFFEKAAKVRIPMPSDTSVAEDDDQSQNPSEEDQTIADEHHDSDSREDVSASATDASTTSSESSFMPGSAAISSTPARGPGFEYAPSDTTDDSLGLWAGSLESPGLRLSRDVQELMRDESSMAIAPGQGAEDTTDQPSVSTSYDLSANPSALDLGTKAKGKASVAGVAKPQQPLLRSVLRQNLASGSTPRRATPRRPPPPSPQVLPALKKQNPFLPPRADADPDDSTWDGIHDLRSPARATSTTQNPYGLQEKAGASSAASGSGHGPSHEPSSPLPLSRPLTMAERGVAPHLGRTPKKQAAERVTAGLLRGVAAARGRAVFRGRAGAGAGRGGPARDVSDSSASTMMTPPSLSRYRHGIGRGGTPAGGAQLSASSFSTVTPPSMSRYGGAGGTAAASPEMSPIPTPPSISRLQRFMKNPPPDVGSVSGRSGGSSSAGTKPLKTRAVAGSGGSGAKARAASEFRTPPPYGAASRRSSRGSGANPAPAVQTSASTRASGDSGRYDSAPAADTTDDSLASLDSMVRRVGLDVPEFGLAGDGLAQADYNDGDSMDDSFGDTVADGALFAAVHAQAGGEDDSFDSSFDSNHSADSFDSGSGGAGAIPLNFGGVPVDGDDGFDDSFEQEEAFDRARAGEREETVFGLAPARPYRGSVPQGLASGGDQLFSDTENVGAAVAGLDLTSPTPGTRDR